MKYIFSIILLMISTVSFATIAQKNTNWIKAKVNLIDSSLQAYTKTYFPLNDFDVYLMYSDNTQYKLISLNIPDLYVEGSPSDVTYMYYFNNKNLMYILIDTKQYDQDFKDIVLYTKELFYVYQNTVFDAYILSHTNTNFTEVYPQALLTEDLAHNKTIIKQALDAWARCNSSQ